MTDGKMGEHLCPPLVLTNSPTMDRSRFLTTDNWPLTTALLPARATSTATTVTAASSTRATPARSAIAAAITTWRTAAFTIEVRLVRGFMSAFERHRNRSTLAAFRAFRSLRRTFAATHLGPLLFQDGLARQLDAIAFDSQHLHQD